MNEFFNNNKRALLMGVLVVIAVISAIIYYRGPSNVKRAIFGGERVVDEVIKIPTGSLRTSTDGWFPSKEAYKVPLNPQNDGERVVVTGAVLTPYGVYTLALPVAQAWESDAKLILMKSLGTVMIDGKSLGWQVVFGSKTKKKGYELVVERDTLITQKEIPSSVFGADVPGNFIERDAVWAIQRLAENPQFSSATMTGLNFVYNVDAKAWDYVIAHSFGGSSVRVR
ncbi:MAG: hypothetical protein A2481_00270 [Candidatus Yonathbacteria bacterium RIFOXYC2_FULL_47_9]|nr:MAG: hypothetical protein A2481_00270 [Candidatus Yonathbacteria bacterium RIFOXYC2_FULL_47_9]HAT68612.1 hypothetical protein [Candidatus Yonathbacteria bacterium]